MLVRADKPNLDKLKNRIGEHVCLGLLPTCLLQREHVYLAERPPAIMTEFTVEGLAVVTVAWASSLKLAEYGVLGRFIKLVKNILQDRALVVGLVVTPIEFVKWRRAAVNFAFVGV